MANQVYRVLSVTVLLVVGLSDVTRNNNLVEGVDFMFDLYAGREDCFFESMEQNHKMYVEYNVIGTGVGDGEINFQLTDPHGRPIVTEFRKRSSSHDILIDFGGEYKVCFDNTYSHFTPKQVAVTISSSSPDEANWNQEFQGTYAEEDSYDVQVQEIKAKLDKIRTAINDIEELQEDFRIIELRDRSISEHNFERVNFWSLIFLVFSTLIGGLQVILLKGLFDPHYDVRKYVKKLVR